jgi:nicotinate-nucleotide pyrophosphorylase (carboxylating)
VHGANRLASNSLLEGLVFAGRIGADLARELPAQADPVAADVETGLVDPAGRAELARQMSAGAGVIRTDTSLHAAARALAAARTEGVEPGPAAWDATNLHTVSTALVGAASGARRPAAATGGRTSRTGRRALARAPAGGPRHRRRTHRDLPGGGMSERELSGLEQAYVDDVVRRALAEDLAGGVDVTSTATVPADQTAVGDLVARADGVVAGCRSPRPCSPRWIPGWWSSRPSGTGTGSAAARCWPP